MLNSNLLQLVSKLNAVEFREFGEFIRSSFFNKNEGVIKLYDFIKIHYPDFDKINFEKETVYSKLFPNIEYDDAFMRKLMFNLTKLAEDYLVYKNISSKNFQYSEILLNEFLKRDLKKSFFKRVNMMEGELDKQKIHDAEYLKNKFRLDAFNESMMLQDSVMVSSKDKPEEAIANYTKSMVNYFLAVILEEYRFLMTYRKIVKFDFDTKFYKCIIDYLSENESARLTPLVSIYFYSVLMIIQKDENYYKKLKAAVMSELDSLSHSDKYSSFAILVNFANDEYQKGNKKYLREAFDLYKLILENKLYAGVAGGAFYNPMFRNIVNAGLLMNQIEWTENFIKTYVNKLIPEAKDNTLYLSNARVNFVKGNYESSLEDLSRITSIHHFQVKPSIKSLTLMIYIEKGWFSEAFDLIDAYRHYISYEKLLPDLSKEKNMNFIKFCGEILKLRSKNSKQKISDLKFDLMNSPNVHEKEWLERKLDEME